MSDATPIRGTVTLRARWRGRPPTEGDFLQSSHRPRTAYKVVDVAIRGAVSLLEDIEMNLVITCERVPTADVPKDATVHDWKWDIRKAAVP